MCTICKVSITKNKFFVEILSFIIFVSILGSSSCRRIEILSNQNITQELSEQTLLEVYTELEGMVYPTGKVLNIKLYSSGKAEYDYYSLERTKKTFKLERKQTFLSREDLEILKAIINDLNLSVVKSEYFPTMPVLDARTTKTVIYKKAFDEIKIVLKENDSDLYLENKNKIYPAELLNLLLFVQKFHQRLLNANETNGSNQSKAEDGTWLKFEYDAANRLSNARKDDTKFWADQANL